MRPTTSSAISSHRICPPPRTSLFRNPLRRLLSLIATLASALPGVAGVQIPVGTSSGPIPVTVNVVASGTINSLAVYTGGIANTATVTQDFSLSDPGTCTTAPPVVAGQTCVANVIFTPKYPGQRAGAVVLLDVNNAVLGTGFVSGIGSGSLGIFTPGQISDFAGNTNWYYRGDGGPATQSSIFVPSGVVLDAAGNLFLADTGNNRVRRVDAITGNISTYAGNGNSGPFGDGGPAIAASLTSPASLALDGAGNLYIADTGNSAIRRVDSSTGLITTVAGTLGASGPTQANPATGDGGPATHAQLSNPYGIALDGNGKLYIGDTGNNVVRVVDLTTGTINLFAGNYTPSIGSNVGDGGPAVSATLNSPAGIAVASTGELYIADQFDDCIRKVALDQTISTAAGSCGNQGLSPDGTLAIHAKFNEPASVALDAAGDLYIADTGNNYIRKVSVTTGNLSTIAGDGNEDYSDAVVPATQAGIYGPTALALDGSGNLYFADYFHNRVRMVAGTAAVLFYPDMRVGRTSAAESQILENDGNTPLNIQSLQAGQNTVIDSTTTCATGQPLAINGTCTIGADFNPQSTGTGVTGIITVNTDAANTPNLLTLEGNVLTLDPPTITVTPDQNPARTGATVTFTITVTSPGVTPTGTVTLVDSNSGHPLTLGTGTLTNGIGSVMTNGLAIGNRSIVANYPGDNNTAPGSSTPITETVKDATTLALISSAPSTPGASSGPANATINTPITFTATLTVSGAPYTPQGQIYFFDGSTQIAGANISNGVATFTTSSLGISPNTHRISASYSGDGSTFNADSGNIIVTINQSTTTTTVTSSNNDATFSNSINLIATVTSPHASPATGTVNFYDGSTLLGNAPLNSPSPGTDPTATYATSSLAVGQHSITATYIGDTDNATSTSLPFQQQIQQITTTTLLATSPSTAYSGTTVHLSATVTPTQTAPANPLSGYVTFYDNNGANTLGTAPIPANGSAATLDVNTFSGNSTHSLTATYTGAADYASSTTAASLSETVNKAPTSGSLTASVSSPVAGKPVTLTAQFTSPGVTPTGLVTLQDGGLNVGQPVPLNAQGVATFNVASFAPASHNLVASYAGDSNNLSSTANLTLTVQQATTTAVLTASPSPGVVGSLVTLSATITGNGGTPSGTVDFRDGSTDLGSMPLTSGGVATLAVTTFGVGSHSLKAIYSGDANDIGSTSSTVPETIQPTTTQITLTPTPNPATQGNSVQISGAVTIISNTGTSNSGTPTGSVQIFDGSTPLNSSPISLSSSGTYTYLTSSLAPGPHNLKASYLGDANDGASSSSVVVEVIEPTTTTTLTSDHNPANAGAILTLTSAVSGSSVVPTGTVTFRDGSTILGTAALSAAGVAVLPVSTLTIGTHSLTATYSGNSANASSTSATYTQTVQQATTQTQLTLSSSTLTLTDAVSLTATVTGNGGIPGGQVTFSDGAATLTTANLGGNGIATVSLNNLTLGQHSITVTYAGDTDDAGSASVPQTLTIVKAVPTVSLSSAPNSSLGGALVTLAATLHSSVNNPTSPITFSENGVPLGTASINAGIATLPISTLAVGQHILTASFPGDASNTSATSPTLTQTVQIASSAITLTSSKNPANVAESVTYTVSLSGTGGQPTGAVTLKDGPTTLGTLTLTSSGEATFPASFPAPGTHTILATYAGDAFHSGSQSSPLAQAVLQTTSSVLTTSTNPSIAGRTLTLAVKVVPANNVTPTGTITFFDGPTALGTAPLSAAAATFTSSTLSVGVHSLTAVYSGDTASQSSTSTAVVETIVDASTNTALTSSANPSISGAALTFTAQVTGQGGTPTGTVIFEDGSVTLGRATLSAAGVAALTTSTLLPGQHTIAAVYTGDANNLTSTSAAVSQLVQQRTTTAIASNNDPALTASAVTLTVSVTNSGIGTPSGTVTLTDGSTTLGTSPLSLNGTATFTTAALAAGTHSLVATYSGDTENFNSSSAAFSQIVNLRSSTTSITSSLAIATAGQTVTLIAVVQATGPATPTGPVIFTSGGATLGSANLNPSGVATLNLTPASGTYNAVAAYQGDALYAPSTSPVSSITVDPASRFTLSINPASLSLQSKQHQTIQLTLTSIKEFQDNLSLGCAGLPYAATCTFSKDQVALQSDGSVIVSVVVDTGSPLTAGGEAQASNAAHRPTTTVLSFLPLGALASLLLLRARPRRPFTSLLTALLLMAAAAGAIGCGSISVNGTPTGAYNVTVTATGATTKITVSQPLTLTVTK